MTTPAVRRALDAYLADRHQSMTAHPSAGADPLTPTGIEARRVALDDEELGLAGLVPVDRILATVGGLIGGALAIGVAIALEVHVAGVRRANARQDAQEQPPR